MQVKNCEGKGAFSQGLELFFEGERPIFVTGLEADTVAGYSLTFLNELWYDSLNVPGRGEVKGLFRFQVSQRKETKSPTQASFEFVFDKALACPTR